jgi:large subunit ribosomal protein L25
MCALATSHTLLCMLNLDQCKPAPYTRPAMKKSVSLTVQARDAAKKPKDLRKAGVVPCVMYGNKTENTSIQCDSKAFHKAYAEAGQNTVVDIDMGGTKIPCLIHAVTLDPITGIYEHIDLYAVDMMKKVTTHVPVVLKGEAPAVKGLGGVLLTVHDELEVSCLPGDIPESFVLDISKLENFHDSITVSTLAVPKGVEIKNNPDTVLVTVQEPRKEEEVAPVAAADATAEGGAAGAEGTAAGAAAPVAAEKKEEKK